MSRKLRKFHTKHQIESLTPVELIKYKKELEKIYIDMKEEVETFINAYIATKKTMQIKLVHLENLVDALENFRLSSTDLENNLHFLNIQ